MCLSMLDKGSLFGKQEAGAFEIYWTCSEMNNIKKILISDTQNWSKLYLR